MFNNLDIVKIYKTDPVNEKTDIVVEFKNPSNVGYIYSLTKNLDKNDLITFTEHVPGELFKRHRELNAISKILWDEGNLTHIRLGHKDYNLYAKPKNDNTKWTDVIPFKLTEDIQKFEIGKLPMHNYNKRMRTDDENDENNENNEHIVEEVVGDIVDECLSISNDSIMSNDET